MIIGEYIVQGNNIKTSLNMRFPGDDLSGQTNSTAIAENGIKPKTIGVNLAIPYVKPQWLKGLREIAEGEDDNGKRKIYDFLDRVSVPMNINQVRFSDNFFVREDQTLKQWLVTFQLTEYRSTPEKAGERKTGDAVTVQKSEGSTVGSSASNNSTNNSTTDATITADNKSSTAGTTDSAPAELTSFEKGLKTVDDWLKEKQGASDESP